MNSIITDRTVLPSPQSLSEMEQIIGYSFQNKRLLEEALTHPSCADSRSYKRLEFFGDAALGLAVSQYIFDTYPCVHSGPLTLLRSAIVSNEKLARVAVRHGFYLRLNDPDLKKQVGEFTTAVAGEDETPLVYGGSVKAPKVLADIVESVAAAIYVDLKYDLKKLWMIFSHLLEPIVTLKDLQDEPHPVTMLVDLCQKNGKQIYIEQWRDATKSTASVYVDGECVASGSSEQKKIARLNAAKIALYKLSKSMGVDHQSFEVIFGIDGSIHIEEAKQKLYGICGKLKWPRPIYNMEKDEGPSHEKKFASSVTIVTVDGTVLSRTGEVKSRIKDADNSAASLMIWALQESDYLVTLKDLQGQLHPVTMSKSMGLDNRIEKDEGPSHEKIFSSLSADQTNKKKESEATMEGLTEGVNNLQITTDSSNKKNRIQVSNTKKPIFFYVNLAKKYMQRNNEVELSAIGMAMSTVVTIAEILKNNGLAFEKRITTSTVDMREDAGGRPIQKAKFEILLGKSDKFDEIMAAAAAAAAAEEDIEYEEQS